MSKPISDSEPQAMCEAPYVIIGGVTIGNVPNFVPLRKKHGDRGLDKKKRSVSVCRIYKPMSGEKNGKISHVCPGRGPTGKCVFFYKNEGTPIPCSWCETHNGINKNVCIAWYETWNERGCQYFEIDGKAK